jgi:hypothetical protein
MYNNGRQPTLARKVMPLVRLFRARVTSQYKLDS